MNKKESERGFVRNILKVINGPIEWMTYKENRKTQRGNDFMNEVVTTRFLLIEDPTVIGEEKDDDTKWWLDTARPLKNPEYPDYPFIVVQTEADKDANNFVRHAKMKLVLKTKDELNALAINDGFQNWEQMKLWFDNEEKMFVGKLIFWKDCVWS